MNAAERAEIRRVEGLGLTPQPCPNCGRYEGHWSAENLTEPGYWICAKQLRKST